MGLLELFILAVGLSMDAFAVSVCKGLAMPKITFRRTVIVGAWFGGFQALMPAVGYLLGVQFRDKITAIDHWIAFILLGVIGANMIKEALSGDCDDESGSLDVRTMFLLAVATSIDALAVGITFAFRRQDRKYFRYKIQIQGRACRRDHPHPPGPQDPAGTPGHPVRDTLTDLQSRILIRYFASQ